LAIQTDFGYFDYFNGWLTANLRNWLIR